MVVELHPGSNRYEIRVSGVRTEKRVRILRLQSLQVSVLFTQGNSVQSGCTHTQTYVCICVVCLLILRRTLSHCQRQACVTCLAARLVMETAVTESSMLWLLGGIEALVCVQFMYMFIYACRPV